MQAKGDKMRKVRYKFWEVLLHVLFAYTVGAIMGLGLLQ
jgi:hypothetical protein